MGPRDCLWELQGGKFDSQLVRYAKPVYGQWDRSFDFLEENMTKVIFSVAQSDIFWNGFNFSPDERQNGNSKREEP